MSVRSGMFCGLARLSTRLADKVVQAPERLPRILGRVAAAFLIFEFIAGFITFMVDTLCAWCPAPVVTFPITELPPVGTHDNDIKVYTSGVELYQVMPGEIHQARRNVFFETFIQKNNKIGRLFKDALIATTRRGVHVFVIRDTFGDLSVPPTFADFPRLTHLHVMRFGLFRSFLLSSHFTGCDHRKLLVMDNRVDFIRGYNIGLLYANQWRNTHLRIEDTATLELTNVFMDFWNTHLSCHLPSLPGYPGQQWSRHIATARNGPNQWLFPVRGLYTNALGRVQRNVWITQAYFIPDKGILDKSTSAVNRGVDVKVLVPEVSSHITVDWVARPSYSPLPEVEVEIWLYQDAMVRTKTATADRVWTTIGTANTDRLSMTRNYEINLEAYSPDLAAQIEQVFRGDLGNVRQPTLAEWEGHPWLTRVIKSVLHPLDSVLWLLFATRFLLSVS